MMVAQRMRGTGNIRNKLTTEDVLIIYRDHATTQTELANRYGVSQSTINHIKRGRTWAWLTQHESTGG